MSFHISFVITFYTYLFIVVETIKIRVYMSTVNKSEKRPLANLPYVGKENRNKVS